MMRFVSGKLILILVLFSLRPLNASKTTELYKTLKLSVAKLNIKKNGHPYSLGSGFFIDGKGTLLTNYHVVENIFNPEFSLEVELSNGIKQTEFKMGKCIPPPIDLCFLKLKQQLSYIDVNSHSENEPGTRVYVVGHPRGLDYSFSDGMISGVREIVSDKLGAVEQVQITAPISPGNSGGPIVDSAGRLVGVSTWIRIDQGSQNLNFGTSAKMIQKHYLSSSSDFQELSVATKKVKGSNQDLVKHIEDKFFKGNWDRLATQGKKKGSPYYEAIAYREAFSKVLRSGEVFKVRAPFFFGECSPVSGKNSVGVVCHNKSAPYVYLAATFFDYEKPFLLNEKHLNSLIGIDTPYLKELKKSPDWPKLVQNMGMERLNKLASFSSKAASCDEAVAMHYFPLYRYKSCKQTVYHHNGNQDHAAYVVLTQLSPTELLVMEGIAVNADWMLSASAGVLQSKMISGG